jgi:hypothetical protein
MKKQIFIVLYFLVFGCGSLWAQREKSDTFSLGSGRIIITWKSRGKAITKVQEWIGNQWRNMDFVEGTNKRKKRVITYTENSNYGIWESTLVYDKRNNIVSETELCTSDIGKTRSDRMLYTYDDKNRFVTQITQTNPDDWQNYIKVIQSYDSIGKLVNTVNQLWGNDNWVNKERYVWVYKGTVIDHGTHDAWDGTKWVPFIEPNYHHHHYHHRI